MKAHIFPSQKSFTTALLKHAAKTQPNVSSVTAGWNCLLSKVEMMKRPKAKRIYQRCLSCLSCLSTFQHAMSACQPHGFFSTIWLFPMGHLFKWQAELNFLVQWRTFCTQIRHFCNKCEDGQFFCQQAVASACSF